MSLQFKIMDNKTLIGLQNKLNLKNYPYDIECFDISHLSGVDTVASRVHFTDALSDKGLYRRYNIKSLESGQIDDFASMREVITRAYCKPDSVLPDLIVIDGGKGQLSSACEVLARHGHDIDNIDIIGLAKRIEEVFKPGKSTPILLPDNSPELFLIQNIRDEAHRFAVSHQRIRRSKTMLNSQIQIKGIGEVTQKRLLNIFNGLEGLKMASVDDLVSKGKLKPAVAAELYNFLHSTK